MNALERKLAWALMVALLVCMLMMANLTRQTVHNRDILEATQKEQADYISGSLAFRKERVAALDKDAANVQTLLDDANSKKDQYLTEHHRTQNMLRTLGAFDPSATQP